MESIGAIDAQSSWRDIVLPLILGLTALFFFLRQRAITPAGSTSASLNEEERRKRREHLAAIAEERAMAKRLQDAHGETTRDSKNKKKTNPSFKKTTPLQSQGEDSIEGGKREASNSADDADASVGKAITENQSANGDREVPPNKTMGSSQEEGVCDCHSSVSEESKIGDEKCERENNSISDGIVDDDDTDAVVEESANDSEEDHGNTGVANEHEDDADKSKLVDPMECYAEDQGTESETDHGERHTKAIANIVAKKEEQKPSVPSLTIYLILTSSPGSPRLELSIPVDLSAAALLHRVSKASGVAAEKLRLIFRGHIITDSPWELPVIDDFNIENGSALHVVGKPQSQQPKEEEEDDNNAEDKCSRNSGEVGEEDNSSSGSENEDGNGSEEDAVHFSGSLARDQVMVEMRSSSGEGFYHRAAQRGDLNALREAVNTGHSDFLHVADSNGWTPLHEAVRAGHVDIVEFLVREGGLNANEVTNQGNGWSPLSLALEHHGRDHPVTAMIQMFLLDNELEEMYG